MRALYFAVFLLGCKHVSELQVASHTDAAAAAEVSTHEVISTGPEHIVMTVEEYEQLCPAPLAQQPKDRPVVPASADHEGAGGVLPADRSVKPPILIRRTVTVTDRGPSLDDLRQLSKVQTDLNTALAVHEKKKDGPAGLLGLLGSLWPVVLIGGAVLAGFVVWKLRPPWLSVIFKLLGRTP